MLHRLPHRQLRCWTLVLLLICCSSLVLSACWLYYSRSSFKIGLSDRFPQFLLRNRVSFGPGHIAAVSSNDTNTSKHFNLPPAQNCSYTTTSRRYVIQWFNWEQLTMATNNLITLSWFVGSWKANVIEPFTFNSKYFGIPSPDRPKLPLFSILDYKVFNKLLCQHSIPPVLKYADFLKHANRHVILIHILYDGFDLTRFGNRKMKREEIISLIHKEGGHYADCSRTKYMKRIGRAFVRKINSMASLSPFKITHYCCVNGSFPTYRDEMLNMCRVPENKDVTVVFTDWKGLSPKRNFRVFVPEVEGIDMPHPSRDLYPYSLSVLSNASRFLFSLTNGAEFIGIHLRTEKLGQKNALVRGYFSHCIRTAQSIKKEILFKFNRNMTVLYFADTGPYGSKSCVRNCLSSQFISSTLTAHGIKIAQYDPHKFGGIVDSGYVASVEQEALSHARALVLVGGGSFQSQVYTRYKHYRRQSAIIVHNVCDNIQN